MDQSGERPNIKIGTQLSNPPQMEIGKADATWISMVTTWFLRRSQVSEELLHDKPDDFKEREAYMERQRRLWAAPSTRK